MSYVGSKCLMIIIWWCKAICGIMMFEYSNKHLLCNRTCWRPNIHEGNKICNESVGFEAI